MEVFQVYEYPRTILIVYQYDSFNKIIRYGATIHHDDNLVNGSDFKNQCSNDLNDLNDLYDREKHLSLALYRYKKKPRIVQIDLSDLDLEEKEKKIRKLLYVYGCG
jgi:hypothetical protein